MDHFHIYFGCLALGGKIKSLLRKNMHMSFDILSEVPCEKQEISTREMYLSFLVCLKLAVLIQASHLARISKNTPSLAPFYRLFWFCNVPLLFLEHWFRYLHGKC